ncbi:MAG: shikimate dehydrogenase [Eggerthellaceae bacterium]
MDARISARTEVYCVFGDPVKHSFSPKLHNKAFAKAGIDGVYVAFTANEQTIGDAIAAVKTLEIRGCSLTMPNKLACIPYLDHIDPTAQMIGSINTLVNNDGVITGYNTDGFGFLRSFEEMGASVEGNKMVLLGLGGAGSAVALTAALDYGLAELSVFNRANGKSWGHAQEIVDLINEKTSCKAKLCDLNDKDLLREEMATAHMLGNTTNVGMADLAGQSVVPDASYFPKGMVVQDAIYSPAKTKLLEYAEEAGCQYTNGLSMLFYQGAKQFELWTGQDMPLTVADLEM